jgi:hypothetical protein
VEAAPEVVEAVVMEEEEEEVRPQLVLEWPLLKHTWIDECRWPQYQLFS